MNDFRIAIVGNSYHVVDITNGVTVERCHNMATARYYHRKYASGEYPTIVAGRRYRQRGNGWTARVRVASVG